MKTVNKMALLYKKHYSTSLSSFLPKSLVVPFNQLSNKRYKCLVGEGDVVMEGQLLAFPVNNDGEDDAAINAPVPGIVGSVVKCKLPNGRMGQGLEIKLSGSFSYLGKKVERRDWNNISHEDILKLLLAKGVVNTFGGHSSLVAQIAECRKKSSSFLVVRMFDEDPSRSTDSFVGALKGKEVAEGAAIIATLMRAQGIVFLLPKKANMAVENEQLKNFPVLSVELDDFNYPSGLKDNIIRFVRKNVKNSQLEYFGDINRDSLFIDSETAFYVQEAIVLGKPLIESYVEVSGACLRSSAIFKVKHGTTIADLARQCGGFKQNPARVVVNGMIGGTMLSDFDVPVTKYVKSLTFLTKSELSYQDFSPCIRCGKCRSVCPEHLFPDVLASPLLFDIPDEEFFSGSTVLCSACKLCNSVCPARIPLAQIIALLKKEA